MDLWFWVMEVSVLKKYAELFTELYITHLNGIKASEIRIQTDNGSEFGGSRGMGQGIIIFHMG